MYKLTSLIFIVIYFLIACNYQEIKYITPVYRFSQQQCFNEISTIAHTRGLSIGASSQSKNDERIKCDLDITLTNGDIQFLNKNELDSIAKLVALQAVRHISNIRSYDWVNVMCQTDLGTLVSEPASKGVYVFRVTELMSSNTMNRPIERRTKIDTITSNSSGR